MAFDRQPPARWDRLETLRAQIAGAARSTMRASEDGAIDPLWCDRIERALAKALAECDRARSAGAVLPVRPPSVGESVEVRDGTIPLPTEAEHAAGWLGRR
jgi:hypothetical protein